MTSKKPNLFTAEKNYINKFDQRNKTNIALIVSIFGIMLAFIFLLILTKYFLFSVVFFFLVGIVLGLLIRSVYLDRKISIVKDAFSRKQQ